MNQWEKPDWMDYAACTGLTDLMHPEHFGNRAAVNQAKLVCQSCTVRGACLEYALDNDEQEGVWGGATPDERAVMLGRTRRRHRRRVA